MGDEIVKDEKEVLNLIITGIPSIHGITRTNIIILWVLNLIITGIPSIH